MTPELIPFDEPRKKEGVTLADIIDWVIDCNPKLCVWKATQKEDSPMIPEQKKDCHECDGYFSSCEGYIALDRIYKIG